VIERILLIYCKPPAGRQTEQIQCVPLSNMNYFIYFIIESYRKYTIKNGIHIKVP